MREGFATTRDDAARQSVVLKAIEAGRFCMPEVKAVARLCEARSEELKRGLLGDMWPEYQALDAEHSRRIEALFQRQPPRFPFVCAVKNCACKHPKAA
jgi:hypothetical protein